MCTRFVTPGGLAFFNGFALFRTLSGFATQYLFYAQLDAIGQPGEAEPGLGVLRAAGRVMGQQRRFLRARAAALRSAGAAYSP